MAAVRTGATPVFATMLRPPSEVVGSKQNYYANRLGSAHLAASWLNMMLHTERGTRESVADGGRVFVRYGDLLDDWVKTSMHVAETAPAPDTSCTPTASRSARGTASSTPGCAG